jgi:hypothetical protein
MVAQLAARDHDETSEAHEEPTGAATNDRALDGKGPRIRSARRVRNWMRSAPGS